MTNDGATSRYILIIETEEGMIPLKFFFPMELSVDPEVERLARQCINDFSDLMELEDVSEV